MYSDTIKSSFFFIETSNLGLLGRRHHTSPFLLITKRTVLVSILFLLLWGCQNPNASNPGNQRPNILFVLTDDQAWNLLGHDGRYPFLETPNLDKLAEEGVVFENSFVTTSLCSPSRASFLSGCYAHRHGVYINGLSDPLKESPMVADILQQSGYETAFIGKWHMEKHANPRSGFNYWLSFVGQGEYIDPELYENGKEFKAEGYITDILTDYAIKWIRQEREKPFCLFLWHKAIHGPFTPAPRDSGAFPDANIQEYENWYDTMEGKPEWLRRGWYYGVHNQVWKESEGKPVPDKVNPRPWDPQNPRWMNYLRTMLAIDRSYGLINTELENLGLLDETVIVYSSDNGFFLGSHQRGDKRLMYEESIRIPLIIRYPKIFSPGSSLEGFALNIDIAPTLIDLAGLNVPSEMQGSSLLQLISDKDTINWQESFLYEYFQESYAPGFVTMLGVRNKRFKYIHFPDIHNDIDELYDLENDPGEMCNLILDPKYQNILNMMKTELQNLLIASDYRKPIIQE